jgi:hypothetical protein
MGAGTANFGRLVGTFHSDLGLGLQQTGACRPQKRTNRFSVRSLQRSAQWHGLACLSRRADSPRLWQFFRGRASRCLLRPLRRTTHLPLLRLSNMWIKL